MDIMSDEEYQEYLDSIGGSVDSYTPDLENIETGRKLAYGAEQEEFLHSVLFTHGKALYDNLFNDMTYGDSLRTQENERQEEILDKFPEMRGLKEGDEDGTVLSGRLGTALVDPITWLIPWTKLGKAATIGGTMAKSGAVGGAFVGADVAAREVAYKGEDASLGTVGAATAIGAIAPASIAGITYKLFPKAFQDELADAATDINKVKPETPEADITPNLSVKETDDLEQTAKRVISTDDVSSSNGISNLSKELEVTNELSRTIDVLSHYRKLYPEGSKAYKTYDNQLTQLREKRTELRDKTIRASLEQYIPEKSEATVKVLEKLKSEGKLTDKILSVMLHEITRPIVGGIGGLAYGGILGDEYDDTVLFGSIAAGATLGFLSRRLETSKTLTDLDIKTGKLILRDSAFSNLRSVLKVGTASTTSTRLEAQGGWNKLIGNMLFSKFGSSADSVEARTIRNQSNFLGRHAEILGDSINDPTVNKVAGEVMRGYTDLDSLKVGYRGITGKYSKLKQKQLDEVRRIVPELEDLVNQTKVRMQEVGLKFEEIEDYGLPQLWDLVYIQKNKSKFLEDLAQAVKIQRANIGKAPDPMSFFKGITGLESLSKTGYRFNSPFGKATETIESEGVTKGDIIFRRAADFFENERALTDKEATRYMAERGWINIDAGQAVGNYGLKSIKVADFVEVFGADGQVINEALTQIKKAIDNNPKFIERGQKYRDQLVESIEAYWGAFGSRDVSRGKTNLIRLGTSLANMSYLTTVTIANFGDLLQPFINSGFGTAAKTLAKRTFAPGSQKFSKLSHFKYDQSWEREYSAMITRNVNPFSPRRDLIDMANSGFFSLVQLPRITKIARNFAYDVGVNNAYSMARKGVPKTKREIKRMEQLGLNVEDLAEIRKYSKITDAFESEEVGRILDRAGRRSADRDAIVPTVGNRLLFSQTNNPYIRPLGQFLSWAQAKSAQTNELIRRVENGDAKLAIASLASVPIYAGVQTLKEYANPEFRPGEEQLTIEDDWLAGLGKALSLSGNYSNFAIDKFIGSMRSIIREEGGLEAVAPSLSFLVDLGVKTPVRVVRELAAGDEEGALREFGEKLPIVGSAANVAERVLCKPLIINRDERAKGGEITNVPNAPEEPDERIDKMTGMPYDQQAGTAFVDEEDPLRRLGFVGGGEVDPLKRLGFGLGSLVGRTIARKAGEFFDEADDVAIKQSEEVFDDITKSIEKGETPEIIEEGFKELFTPVKTVGQKGKKQIVKDPDKRVVMTQTEEIEEELSPRFKRAMESQTAASVMPAPGKFFDPEKRGFKGEKFVEGMKGAGIEVDLELGNYISMAGKPSDVTDKTFQNLYVTARPSEKLSTFGKSNKSVARVNEYDGENLTLAQMKANYKKNTGDKNPTRVRTNLLQPEKFAINTKQGLKRLDNPIVSIEGKDSKHFYTLDTQFVGPVRMNREGTKGAKIPQPNLRPETVGNITLGKIVGQVFVYSGKKGYTTIDGKKGKLHPIYDYIEVDGTPALPEGVTVRDKFLRGGKVLNALRRASV